MHLFAWLSSIQAAGLREGGNQALQPGLWAVGSTVGFAGSPACPRCRTIDAPARCAPSPCRLQASLAPAFYRPRRTLILASCRLAAAALPRHSAPLRLPPSAMHEGSWGGWAQFALLSGALVRLCRQLKASGGCQLQQLLLWRCAPVVG